MSKNKKPSEIHQKTLEAIGETLEYKNLFPEARKLKRKIIFHCGEINSGKSHFCFESIKENNYQNAIYAAPLRLLATQGASDIEKRLNGIRCNIITGDYEQIYEGSNYFACTIEMVFSSKVKLNNDQPFDVAIIDEIQMINHENSQSRSQHWAAALVGINAKVVYIAGSDEVLNIVKKIVEYTGDELEIKNFKRLCPIEILKKPIALKDVKERTAIVAFSRREILMIRDYLHKLGFKTSCLYGSLSPSTRLSQIKKFNEKETDILVTTDVISCGINGYIETVLLNSSTKYNGIEVTEINNQLLKQIVGRSGRYNMFPKGFGGATDAKTCKFLNKMYTQPLIPFNGPVYFGPTKETILKLKDLGHTWSKAFSIWKNVIKTTTPGLFIPVEIDENMREVLQILDNTNIESNDLAYGLTMAPVSDNNQSYFIDICNAVKMNRHFDLPRFATETLLSAEITYSKLMLYAWLSYRYQDFCKDEDVEKLDTLLETINNVIDKFLSDKNAKFHVCETCGIPLPINHLHKKCDECYHDGIYNEDDDFDDE